LKSNFSFLKKRKERYIFYIKGKEKREKEAKKEEKEGRNLSTMTEGDLTCSSMNIDRTTSSPCAPERRRIPLRSNWKFGDDRRGTRSILRSLKGKNANVN
jgi:hypothetical protein